MQNAECRIRHADSRITHHPSSVAALRRVDASRITPWAPRASWAFTLIELLVVIAVIAILAALTFPAVQGVKASAIRTRARGELTTFETAIERFYQKLGYYPPDNPPNWHFNQLYYELLGTTNIAAPNALPVYATLDGSAQIKGADLPTVFGPNVTGFVNCSRPGRSDDVPGATAFLNNLKPSQFMVITNGASPISCSVLGSGLEGWPTMIYTNNLGVKLNPWRYNSSNPYHNPKTFDLWIDVKVGSKTNRICNWSDKPLVVNGTYPP
jgi:prepilin-type N-terminal cleavage/methylation domain-containing protein